MPFTMRILMLAATIFLVSPAGAEETRAPTPPTYVQHVEDGIIKNGCSKDGIRTFVIDLKNTHTVVYASLDDIEKGGSAVVFEADPKIVKTGMAQITKCDRSGKLCKLKDGIVSVTTIEPERVIGVVQINMAGWGRSYNGNESHMFKAKYDRTEVTCIKN